MATFAPNTKIDPGREYDFRGAEPNLAGGVLLKGTANAMGEVIDAEYKAVNQDIRERARAGEESIQDNLFATGDIAAAQSSTTEAGVARPEELVRGFGKMEKLKNAWMKGAITESDYLSSIDVLTKSLRQRYGNSWADEIDSAVAGAVSNSANSYRKQLFEEWNSKKSAADKEAEKNDTFKRQLVKENAEYLIDHPDILADPTKFTEGEIYAAFLPAKSAIQKVKDNEILLNHEKSIRGVKEDEVVQVGRSKVSSFVQSVIGGVTNANKQGLFDKIQEMQKSGGTIDAEEKLQLRQYIASLRAEIETGTNQILLSELYAPLSDSAKNDIRGIATKTLDMYENMIFNEKYGPLTLFSSLRKFRADDTVNQAMKVSPDVADFVALNDSLEAMGLGKYAEEDMIEKFGNIKDQFDPSQNEVYQIAGNILTGNATFADYLRAVQSARKDTSQVPKVLKKLTGAITSDNTDPETKATAAEVLFDPKNGDVLAPDLVNPEMAVYLLQNMTTPDMIKTMKSLKEVNPQAWSNYYDWVFDSSFKSIFSKQIGNVIPEQASLTNLKFNENKMRFEYEIPNINTAKGKANLPWIKQLDNTVQSLNNWILRVSPLIQAEGLDPNEELMKVLESADLPVALNGRKSLLEDFKKIVSSNAQKKSDLEGSPKKPPQ